MDVLERRLTALLVRRTVAAVCALCVVAMIASAATHHLGAVLALGCCSTGAIITLMAVIATSGPSASVGAGQDTSGSAVDAAQARQVEALVAELSGHGADENRLRDLVGAAINLGRGRERGR